MSQTVALKTMGGFGNQLFQYAFARAYAERHGFQLQVEPWVGQRIFNLPDPSVAVQFNRRSDADALDGEGDVELRGYFQQQKCLIYAREQVRRWFTLKPEIKASMDQALPKSDFSVLAHLRNYGIGSSYVMPSVASYRGAWHRYFPNCKHEPEFVSEDEPFAPGLLGNGLEFLPDFYRMMRADVLFRANSTFSWWAAVLGNSRVFSPIITGRMGGATYDDIEFVEGNWPKCIDGLPCITDLFMAEK